MESRDIIRERMLSNLNDAYDKLPGTWTWETYQAMAIEKENTQILVEDGINQAFAGTADLEHLKVMAFEDRGIIYRDATFASGEVTVTGTPGAVISTGDLFASQLQQYAATESVTLPQTGTADVKVQCTEAGVVGNTPVGTITEFPKTITGINAVTNATEFSNGFEEEGRDSLLERYYLAIRNPGTSGNVAHYTQWALSVSGVGAVKVKPLWNGNGTVKLVILDTNKDPADAQLITDVSDYVETQRPIGANVTVVAPTELSIDINADVTIKTGYTLNQVKNTIESLVTAYFEETAFVDQTIYYAKVGNIIFNAEGVSNLNYSTFTLNSAKNDIILLDSNTVTQIAKLGTLTIA